MIKESGVQFIWQTGKYYNASIMAELKQRGTVPSLHVTDLSLTWALPTRPPTW